jgi:hypothetical protein
MTPKITAHGGGRNVSDPAHRRRLCGGHRTRGLKPDVVAVINAGAKDHSVVSAVTKAKLPRPRLPRCSICRTSIG